MVEHALLDIIQQVAIIVTSLVTLASSITAVTDTPQGEGLHQRLYKILEFLALVTEKTKQK